MKKKHYTEKEREKWHQQSLTMLLFSCHDLEIPVWNVHLPVLIFKRVLYNIFLLYFSQQVILDDFQS